MALSIVPIKAKEVTLMIKEQHDKKLRNDGLEFSLSIDKAAAAHVDVLFLWENVKKRVLVYQRASAV